MVTHASPTLAAPALSAEERRALLGVARRALADALGGRPLALRMTETPALLAPRASFVTLIRRDTGDLRGCRGEVLARRPLVESVARMAIAAATDDPRFPAVTSGELPLIRITINALTAPVPVRAEDVVVGRHGLILEVGGGGGLLLPEVPVHHGWDRERFLAALCRKAGVPEDAWTRPDAELSAFETEAWSED
jgi:AmmeMemoRadiSam system protein A